MLSTSKICSSFYGYTTPYIYDLLFPCYYFQIFSMMGSSESIVLNIFSAKTSIIFLAFDPMNALFNFYYPFSLVFLILGMF